MTDFKIKSLVLLSFLLLGVANLFAQESFVNDLLSSKQKSIEISLNNQVVFLFSPGVTKKYFSRKRFRYLNYWKISNCSLYEVEDKVKEYLNLYHSQNQSSDKFYVRQYFPFINKDGEMIVGITLSLFDDVGFTKSYNKLSKYFRSIYDGGDRYIFLIYNYSDEEFMENK